MDKKKIMSTTIMFLVIVISIVLFGAVFGPQNTLVGVAGITATLSLLGTDYTINPIKNTIYFVLLEVGLGVCAYLASTSAVLGLVITFIVIFIILYNFTYNTKKPTYVAFTLGYFFMLYKPVTIDELPVRLAGLFVCGLAIMGVQMAANKNKLYKDSKNGINNSITSINREIFLMVGDEDVVGIEEVDCIDSINKETYNNLRNIVTGIYKIIDNNANLPALLIQYLFISQCLESINITLGKIKNSEGDISEYKIIFDEINIVLYSIDDFVNDKISLENLFQCIDIFLNKTKKLQSKKYYIYEIKEYLNTLKKELEDLQKYNIEKTDKEDFPLRISKKIDKFKNNIDKESLKFTFALRGAIVTSLGVFIVAVFNLEYGKWLVFSLSAIVQPYLEPSKTKGKDRIVGTIIGLIVFEILFSIVTNNSVRTIIILLTGYINNYQTRYRNQMICTTVSALGAAAVTANINLISFDRMIFVLLGTGIALFANKIILPYKMSDTTKNEIKKSIKLNQVIVDKLNDIITGKLPVNGKFKGIMTINEYVNQKIDSNNATLLSKNIDDFLYNQRIFMNEVRFLVNNINEQNKVNIDTLKLFYNIDLMQDEEAFEKDFMEYFRSIEDDKSKLLLVDVIEINHNLIETIRISKLIEQEL